MARVMSPHRPNVGQCWSCYYSEALRTPLMAGLGSQQAHVWAKSNYVPCCEALETQNYDGLCSHTAHLWVIARLVPRSEAFGTPQRAGVV